ncbi:GNAT family N-acetyltransferase [Pseudomonas izuensis]|uniref:GNAT family N-acetyltransferase n=1 Tax=Pseudomonas izuensis TaxID=2684212 RepID=UPI00135755F7|nr:GNAT family N-acetyltransferase [Pseudomonas izuensis]
MLRAVDINSPDKVMSEVLRERIVKGKNPNTREFLILLNDEEVGLLIYEDSGHPQSFIYEIFVLRDARKGGIGTWILSQAERVATELRRTSICLTARSLYQDELSDEDLVSWYEKQGYIRNSVERNRLEKALSIPPEL